MTEPPRLLECADADVRELLATALNDAPNSRALPALRISLGVLATAGVAAIAAQGHAGENANVGLEQGGGPPDARDTLPNGGAGELAGGTALGGALKAALIVKLLIGGALLGGALVGSTLLRATTSLAPERRSEATPLIAVPTPRPTLEPAAPAASPTRGRDNEALPSPSSAHEVGSPTPPSLAPQKPAKPRRPTSAGGVGRQPVDDGVLATEVRWIDRARRALKSRDPHRALAALDRYDASSPQRVLGPEALLLRSEALAMKNEIAAARRSERLRRLAGTTAPK